MAVDYEEGRRLLKAYQDFLEAPEGASLKEALDVEDPLARFMILNAKALLNPDPWRPISELEDKHKDGRTLDLWVRDYADGGFRVPDCKWGAPWSGAAPCWLELKPHPDARHDWEWQPIDFAPTHFREIKGPGQ